MAARGVRLYVHPSDPRYLTFCPDDGRGDVVLRMPEFHESPTSDYNRLVVAIDIVNEILSDWKDAKRELRRFEHAAGEPLAETAAVAISAYGFLEHASQGKDTS